MILETEDGDQRKGKDDHHSYESPLHASLERNMNLRKWESFLYSMSTCGFPFISIFLSFQVVQVVLRASFLI